jgi:cytoskeletal protein CcmA (bactofilin family)
MSTTVIGSSIVIDGEVTGEEDLVVLGTVKGRISIQQSIRVESSGVVDADIGCSTAIINGQVTGNVVAKDRLDLRSDARLVGDIKAGRILIAEGATFRGNVDMDL